MHSLYDRDPQPNLGSAESIDYLHYFANLDLITAHKQYDCYRYNHINRLNNGIFAQHVTKWLYTHDVNEVCNIEWQPDTEQPWDYYFKKIK